MNIKTDVVTGLLIPLLQTFKVPIILPANGAPPYYGDRKFASEFYAHVTINNDHPVNVANWLFFKVKEVYDRNPSPLVAISFRWGISNPSDMEYFGLFGFLREDGSGDVPLEHAKEQEACRIIKDQEV